MSNTFEVQTGARLIRRTALFVIASAGMLAVSTPTAGAQTPTPQTRKWEFRATSGALVTTGDQRNVVKNSQASAAQVSWLVRPSVALTGTFGWAWSRDVSMAGSPKLDVFTSDIGVESRGATWFAGRAVSFSPFVGVGAGARSYNYRKLDVDARTNAAGYASVGGEFGVGRVGVRLEARDYATGFKPLIADGKSQMRNDVVIMAALRFNRRASQNVK